MKKMYVIFVAVLAMFAFTACGNNSNTTNNNYPDQNQTSSDANGFTYVAQGRLDAKLRRYVDGTGALECTFRFTDNENVDKSAFVGYKLLNDGISDDIDAQGGSTGSKGKVSFEFPIFEDEEAYSIACALDYYLQNGTPYRIRSRNIKFPPKKTEG